MKVCEEQQWDANTDRRSRQRRSGVNALRGNRASLTVARLAELERLLKQPGMIEITGMTADEIAYLETRQRETSRRSAMLDIGIEAAELGQLLRHGTVEEALVSYTEMLDERNAADGGNREPLILKPEE
jgi:hypothetical protein